MRIVLDTNALMMPVEVGVRLFEELDRLLGPGAYEPIVPRAENLGHAFAEGLHHHDGWFLCLASWG
jgi:hypothetical protein